MRYKSFWVPQLWMLSKSDKENVFEILSTLPVEGGT